jgi:hypothetical protein
MQVHGLGAEVKGSLLTIHGHATEQKAGREARLFIVCFTIGVLLQVKFR